MTPVGFGLLLPTRFPRLPPRPVKRHGGLPAPITVPQTIVILAAKEWRGVPRLLIIILVSALERTGDAKQGKILRGNFDSRPFPVQEIYDRAASFPSRINTSNFGSTASVLRTDREGCITMLLVTSNIHRMPEISPGNNGLLCCVLSHDTSNFRTHMRYAPSAQTASSFYAHTIPKRQDTPLHRPTTTKHSPAPFVSRFRTLVLSFVLP
ncbi:hypothetical protein VUR80DRAFT_9019 [Thermomyces stellatus]